MGYLTVKKVSDQTGVSVATIRRWCEEGKVPGAHQSVITIGSGRVWLIPEESVAKLPEIQPAGRRSPKYKKNPKTEKS